MKIAQSLKAEMIFISFILLTACGTQPTGEPTPVSTVVLIQTVSSPTPSAGSGTSTPVGSSLATPDLPATITPEARMTVEQQLAYLESHGVPAIINEKGEVVFDWQKMTSDPESMPVVHQETLADDLAFWAEIFHNGFPEPNTHDPADFSPVGWYSTVEEEKQYTAFAVNIISEEHNDKPSPHQTKAVAFGMIDEQLYAFYFGRGLVIEPEEVVKNGGKHFVEFWVQDSGSGYTQKSSAANNVTTINAIINGTYLLGMDNINGTVAELQTRPAPEWTSWQRANFHTWHLLNADLVDPNGQMILSVEDDALLQRLVAGKGFSAAFNGKLFTGGITPVTDILPASHFVSTPVGTTAP